MELISVGNVILKLDQISALDIDQKDDGAFVLRVLTDSPDPIISLSLAPEVPDLLFEVGASKNVTRWPGGTANLTPRFHGCIQLVSQES